MVEEPSLKDLEITELIVETHNTSKEAEMMIDDSDNEDCYNNLKKEVNEEMWLIFEGSSKSDVSSQSEESASKKMAPAQMLLSKHVNMN